MRLGNKLVDKNVYQSNKGVKQMSIKFLKNSYFFFTFKFNEKKK